jgi:hypothetical protein
MITEEIKRRIKCDLNACKYYRHKIAVEKARAEIVRRFEELTVNAKKRTKFIHVAAAIAIVEELL